MLGSTLSMGVFGSLVNISGGIKIRDDPLCSLDGGCQSNATRGYCSRGPPVWGSLQQPQSDQKNLLYLLHSHPSRRRLGWIDIKFTFSILDRYRIILVPKSCM